MGETAFSHRLHKGIKYSNKIYFYYYFGIELKLRSDVNNFVLVTTLESYTIAELVEVFHDFPYSYSKVNCSEYNGKLLPWQWPS